MPSARKCRANPGGVGLASLRRLLGVTQTELSRAADISQPYIAKLEGQQDMHVSTLARYVAGLGGELVLLVRLPGGSEEIRLAASSPPATEQEIQQPTGNPPCHEPAIRIVKS
jgi:transcriptional regulator with XRE-family HTH domain